MSEKYHFECIDCGAEYGGEQVIYLCPACSKGNKQEQPPRGVLKTVFANDRLLAAHAGGDLFDWLEREQFLPLTPLRGMESWTPLRVGRTPLYRVGRWIRGQGDKGSSGLRTADCGLPTGQTAGADFELFLKDDSQNPTFSFKDRASALVSAWAGEHGIETLVAASTGNAGSSLAGICASVGQQAIIVVPAAAPLAKLTQVLMYGATLVPVMGTYDDACDLSVKLTEQYGWYNRNTAYNPLTIEGKKTVSFEIYRQMGRRVPDRIFIPVGDGVILSGVAKGFEDLFRLGIISRMPVLVSVQSEASSNLIDNLDRELFISTPSSTLADSISVDVPRCFHMTGHYLKEFNGEAVKVSDAEIIQASVQLARMTGIFCEPAAAAAYAGMHNYREAGKIPAGTSNVVLLTGSGLKDLKSVQSSIVIPDPIEPDIKSAEKFLGNKLAGKS